MISKTVISIGIFQAGENKEKAIRN